MPKKNSLEKLLRRKQQRTSLDLPEPSLQPVATPVETGYQVPLAPYMPTDKRRATASLVKGLEGFNRGLVGVAEKINDEMMKEQAIKEGVAISAAADKYIVFEDGKPVEKEETFPGGAIAKSQNLSPEDEKIVADGINEEVTQQRGYPRQRERAYQALERQGIDVTILPRWRRLWEQEEARKFSDVARAHVDNATAALVEPDSKLTVEELIVEAMQDATGDKSLDWAGILAMSPAISEEFQDLKNKKEQRLLPAKSEARQAALENQTLDNARTKMTEVMNLLVQDSPEAAVKAQAVLISMFEGIVSSRDTEGLQGGPRIRRQVFRELKKMIFSHIGDLTLKTDLDVQESLIALETSRDLVLGTGPSEPLLRQSAAMPTPNPNEEAPIMLDGLKQAEVGADQQVKIKEEVAKGNSVPDSGEPVGTEVHAWMPYALATRRRSDEKTHVKAARFADTLMVNPEAFTAADGKTKTDMEGFVKSYHDFLTREWDNKDLEGIVEETLTNLEKSNTSLGREYKDGSNEVKAKYRAAIIGAMRSYIDYIQKDRSDTLTQIDANQRRAEHVEDREWTMETRDQQQLAWDHAAVTRKRAAATNAFNLESRDVARKGWEYDKRQREYADTEKVETEYATDLLSEGDEVYRATYLRAIENGDPRPNEAAEAAATLVIDEKVDNPNSINNGDKYLPWYHTGRKDLLAEWAKNATVDTFMARLAGAVGVFGQGTSEYARSTTPGEVPEGGPSAMPGAASVGHAFAKFKGLAAELQAEWITTVKNSETAAFKDTALRSLFFETDPEKREGLLDAQSSLLKDKLQEKLDKIYEKGEDFLRQQKGITDTVAPQIFDVEKESASQLEIFNSETGPFVKINAELGGLPAESWIDLFSRPYEHETRKDLIEKTKEGIKNSAIPMLQAINQIGLGMMDGNFSHIPGWDGSEVKVKGGSGHTVTVGENDFRRAFHQAVQHFGYPKQFWMANSETMELTPEFIASNSTGVNTPMLRGRVELDGFEQSYDGKGWDTLHARLLAEKIIDPGTGKITTKLGVMADGEAPSLSEFITIQTRMSYAAGRLAIPFDSTNGIVRQTADYTSLGFLAEWQVRKHTPTLGPPRDDKKRVYQQEAVTRAVGKGGMREIREPTLNEKAQDRIERAAKKYRESSVSGKVWHWTEKLRPKIAEP